MKKIVWIVGTGIVCILYSFLIAIILVVGNIATSIVTHAEIQSLNQDLFNIVMSIGFAAIIILSIVIWKRLKNRCPTCKQWRAIELAKTEVIKQENVSVLATTTQRNRNGEVTGTSEQYVPGKRETLQDTYKCKYCGHCKTYIRAAERANI